VPKIIALRCNHEAGLQCTIPGAAQIIYQNGATSIDVSSIPETHRGEVDCIVMYGSHGNFVGNKPTQLNGLSADVAETLAGQLCSLGITAYTIILDCCFSAGFIPVYKDLLVKGRTKPGTILAHYGSAAGTMASSLGTSQYTARNAAISKFKDLEAFGLDFVSLGIYVDGPKDPNYYIKSVSNLASASASYIGAIAGGSSEAADIIGLKTYLKSDGVVIKESTPQIVQSVMQNAIIV